MEPPALDERELRRIRAYRRAARQVFDAFLSVSARRMEFNLGSDEAELFEPAEFVRLLTAIRLVYMEREDGFFNHANNIVAKHGGPDFRQRAARIRQRWKAELSGDVGITLREGEEPDGREAHRYELPDLLDVWMNAKHFHQDFDKLPDLERLEAMGNVVPIWLHVAVRQLARVIIGQDIIVAEFMGEPRLPLEELPVTET